MKDNKSQLVIVEDDQELGELLKDFFSSQSYEVHLFALPSEALMRIEEFRDKAAVVITDLNLPEESGVSLIKKIKSVCPQLPIIMMTVNNDVDAAIEAIEAGAYDFVLKPLHFPQLLISVKRALHYRQISLSNEQLSEFVNTQLGSKSVGLPGVIGRSAPMKKVFELVKRVAPSSSTIFISGESGTGKEVIAKAIHELSPRREKPFVAINCSAIPEALLETELFGHAKGAFTGATDKKVGLFETADGGTLFLDEIADLTLPLQAKILRVLQERKLKRVGENAYRDFDVRIITATHKNLIAEVKENRFREDLYYRLNVIPIHLPPLRERKDDIVPLVDFFLKKHATLSGEAPKKLAPETVEFLIKQTWRGNVRELENALERAIVLSETNVISPEHFLILDLDELYESSSFSSSNLTSSSGVQHAAGAASSPELTRSDCFISEGLLDLETLNDAYIQYILSHSKGGKEEAAKILGIDRKTLYRRLNKFSKSPRNNAQDATV